MKTIVTLLLMVLLVSVSYAGTSTVLSTYGKPNSSVTQPDYIGDQNPWFSSMYYNSAGYIPPSTSDTVVIPLTDKVGPISHAWLHFNRYNYGAYTNGTLKFVVQCGNYWNGGVFTMIGNAVANTAALDSTASVPATRYKTFLIDPFKSNALIDQDAALVAPLRTDSVGVISGVDTLGICVTRPYFNAIRVITVAANDTSNYRFYLSFPSGNITAPVQATFPATK